MAEDAPPVSERIVPDMFKGPARLDALLPLLRRLPAPLSRQMLVSLAIGDGILRDSRRRRVLTWAGAQRTGGAARWGLALSLLATHGRFVADEAMIGVPDLETLRRNVAVEGKERLTGLTSGAILLGFHLGPPRTAFILRTLGFPVCLTGRLESVRRDARWTTALQASDAVRLPAGAPRGRGESLHQLRTLLRQGKIVYLTADGPFGREAFRIDLPGRPLVARLGWLTLRRLTRVPTFPILTYREHGRRVIVVHSPLPDPQDDPASDVAACRAVLTPLVEEYLRRFPSQCRYLAFPSWAARIADPSVS